MLVHNAEWDGEHTTNKNGYYIGMVFKIGLTTFLDMEEHFSPNVVSALAEGFLRWESKDQG